MSLFSARLIEQREKMGWTRKRAVSELGMPYSTYAGYEQAHREPDIDTLKLIAKKYETTTDYLTGNTNDPSPASNDVKEDTAITWNDLGVPMPYGGKIPDDLKHSYQALAKDYFERHPEYLNESNKKDPQ